MPFSVAFWRAAIVASKSWHASITNRSTSYWEVFSLFLTCRVDSTWKRNSWGPNTGHEHANLRQFHCIQCGTLQFTTVKHQEFCDATTRVWRQRHSSAKRPKTKMHTKARTWVQIFRVKTCQDLNKLFRQSRRETRRRGNASLGCAEEMRLLDGPQCCKHCNSRRINMGAIILERFIDQFSCAETTKLSYTKTYHCSSFALLFIHQTLHNK